MLDGARPGKEEADRPFQCLDFLVRDWRHFRDDWTVAQCEDAARFPREARARLFIPHASDELCSRFLRYLW